MTISKLIPTVLPKGRGKSFVRIPARKRVAKGLLVSSIEEAYLYVKMFNELSTEISSDKCKIDFGYITNGYITKDEKGNMNGYEAVKFSEMVQDYPALSGFN